MTKRRRRRRLKKGPVIVLALILLSIFGGIYFYTHSKKYLFLKGLDKSYDQIIKVTSNFIDNYMPYTNSNYYNNINSSFKVTTSEIDATIGFVGDVYMNDSSNYFDLNINTNGNEYGLNLLSKNNKLYFKIDDSKYYYTDFSNNNFSTDVYSELLEIFIDSLKDNIKKSNLEKESSKVVVNSKNYDTKKITLHIDNELYSKIVKSFYSNIKDNDDMLDVLLPLTNFSEKKELVNYLKSNNVSLSNDIYLSVYLYKSNLVKTELSYDSDQSISFISHDNYLEFNTVVEDSTSYIKFDNSKIDLFIDGIGYGTGTYDNKSFKIDFTDYNKNSIGNISYSMNDHGNKYSNKITLNLDLTDININIDSSNEIEVDKKAPNINVNDSIIVDNISVKDQETLSELLTNINLIFAV